MTQNKKSEEVKGAEKTEVKKTPARSAKTEEQSSQKNSSKSKKTIETKSDETKTRKTDVKKAASKKEKTAAEKSSAKGTEKTSAEAKSPVAKSAAAAATAKRQLSVQEILLIILTCILCLSLVLGLILGFVFRGNSLNMLLRRPVESVNEYKSTTKVGYHSETLGVVERVKPVSDVRNDGTVFINSEYPKWGQPLNSVLGSGDEQQSARRALINEASYLSATGTWNGGGGEYKWMDKDGFLYSGTVDEPIPTLYHSGANAGQHRQLYMHTAAEGLYGGNVSDEEPRLIKQVTLNPRGYNSYSVTGLYAPAGEVIKIEMSEADMEATGGIVVHIGQALYNGKANNIWVEKNQMQRFPILLNTMVVDKSTATLENGVYTAYVGSFIGGPLYIRNENVTFSAKITGGVTYSHFILGYTSESEFEQNAKSTAPYFDLEVWNYGVLHSGPVAYAKNYSYAELYKAAVLWEKVSLVSTAGSQQGIVFLYDPFVAAGAAVAFPGQGSVNCPASWMSGSLNYEGLVKNGSWGNFHEYHHNFQGYGVGAGGEVTNNGMTLVSYALFTKISSARSSGNYGAAGLSGWNCYTSATWALNEVLKIPAGENPSNGTKGLSLYATLLHNFGADKYMQAKICQRSNRYGESYEGYLKAWQDVTHNDMTYFFKDILGGISQEEAEKYTNSEYSMFVPVSSFYQTGRSYMLDGQKEYFSTMQPYVIPFGQEFTVDLRRYVDALTGSIVLPEGFSYSIKNITKPEHGELVATEEENVFKYIPEATEKGLSSGRIAVTLSITKDDEAFLVDDVDLVLEFVQSHENTKWITERTTYTYDGGYNFESAEAAYTANYAGYTSVESGDNINPTLNGKVVQNCNAEVWYIDKPDKNAVVEIKGKFLADEAGKYRVALRGRWSTALYVSVGDDKNFELAATYTQPKNKFNASFPNVEGTYKDYEIDKADVWIYFKAVLLTDNDGARASFVGVGFGKFTPEQGTYDEETGEIVGYQPESVKVSYTNAYRSDYVFPSTEFETDYFYTRDYAYDYKDNSLQSEEQKVITNQCNYSEAPQGWGWGNSPIESVADGDKNTFIHTSGGVSQENPLVLVLDMGEPKNVNRLVLYSRNRPNGDWKLPVEAEIHGSLDGVNYFKVKDYENIVRTGSNVIFNFENTEMRYYKLVITKSYSTHIIISELEMWNTFEINGGKQLSCDDSELKFKGAWTSETCRSSFGHVYVGKTNSTMEFEFEGQYFAILSKFGDLGSYEVYVDGKRVTSAPFGNEGEYAVVTFLSEKLENGKHKVAVKCNGNVSVDSVVVWNVAAES